MRLGFSGSALVGKISLARSLGLLNTARLGWTRAEGKEMMGRRSTWTSKDDDLLRALAASGENSAAIAVRLNRTAAGIRKRATSLGIGLAGSRKALGLKAKGKWQKQGHTPQAANGLMRMTLNFWHYSSPKWTES
jgi:hypothetical protein